MELVAFCRPIRNSQYQFAGQHKSAISTLHAFVFYKFAEVFGFTSEIVSSLYWLRNCQLNNTYPMLTDKSVLLYRTEAYQTHDDLTRSKCLCGLIPFVRVDIYCTFVYRLHDIQVTGS